MEMKTKLTADMPAAIPPDPFAAHDGAPWWGRHAWYRSEVPELFIGKLQRDGWAAFAERGGQFRQVLRRARAFARWPWKPGLFLSGPVGCGKTMIACCVLREMILTAKGVGAMRGNHAPGGIVDFWYPEFRFINVPHLLTKVKNTFNRLSREEPTTMDVIREYAEADVLVLDDIGAEAATDWVKSFAFEVIDARYTAERSTILTSNCSLDELAAQLGERVADRIAEMCAGHIHRIAVRSYRLELAARSDRTAGSQAKDTAEREKADESVTRSFDR